MPKKIKLQMKVSETIELQMKMPEKVWAEVYYAVQSKISAISKGDYDPEDETGQTEKWLVDLAYAQTALTIAFNRKKINY